jgi:hypothetical protein
VTWIEKKYPAEHLGRPVYQLHAWFHFPWKKLLLEFDKPAQAVKHLLAMVTYRSIMICGLSTCDMVRQLGRAMSKAGVTYQCGVGRQQALVCSRHRAAIAAPGPPVTAAQEAADEPSLCRALALIVLL